MSFALYALGGCALLVGGFLLISFKSINEGMKKANQIVIDDKWLLKNRIAVGMLLIGLASVILFCGMRLSHMGM